MNSSNDVETEREIAKEIADLSYKCVLAERQGEKIIEVHDETIKYWCKGELHDYFILNNVFVCRKGFKEKVENEHLRTPADILFPHG